MLTRTRFVFCYRSVDEYKEAHDINTQFTNSICFPVRATDARYFAKMQGGQEMTDTTLMWEVGLLTRWLEREREIQLLLEIKRPSLL